MADSKNKDMILNIPYIEDAELYQAVRKAIWLITEKDATITNAIKWSAGKYKTVTQAKLHSLVRPAFPDWFINERKCKAIAGSTKAQVKIADSGARKRSLIIEDKNAAQHMANIAGGF